MSGSLRFEVLALECATASLCPFDRGCQRLPCVHQGHAGAAQRPQLRARPILTTSLLLGLELGLAGPHRLDHPTQRVDGDVLGVSNPLLGVEVVAAHTVIAHDCPSEGLCFQAPPRPVATGRGDLTTVPRSTAPQPGVEFAAPGRREGTPMQWPSRPRSERARSSGASITVLLSTASPEEGYQLVALRELLHRSRQHALSGQTWAATTGRPDLEDACRDAACALAEAIDILGGPDRG